MTFNVTDRFMKTSILLMDQTVNANEAGLPKNSFRLNNFNRYHQNNLLEREKNTNNLLSF